MMPMPSRPDRLLGHGDHDDGQVDARLADPLGHLEAVDPALEQRVDHEDVRPQLSDLVQHDMPVGQDVEQLNLVLRAEQVPDVLRDLGDVLDQQQADLF